MFSVLFLAVSVIWVGSEVLLSLGKRSRSPDSRKQDRFSHLYIWIAITFSVVVGNTLGWQGIGYIPSLHHWISWLGLGFISLGLALRWTAILTLKKYFTVNLSIAMDHQLVDRGVYRYVRHPSYAGSLLSFLGLGLAFSSWVSVLVVMIPITLAFLYRIWIEEQMLRTALREVYARYSLTTKRLIPFIY